MTNQYAAICALELPCEISKELQKKKKKKIGRVLTCFLANDI